MNARLILVALATAAPAIFAQGALDELDATVDAVANGNVRLDVGADDGVLPGDRVVLRPATGPEIETAVSSVTRASTYAALPVGADEGAVDIGMPAVVFVPADRESSGAPRPPVEWSTEREEWSESLPLLAPTTAPDPGDEPLEVHGRLLFQADMSKNDAGEGQRYGFYRTGVDIGIGNLFGNGGVLEIDAEVRSRTFDAGAEGETDSDVRLDRLSYTFGGDRGRPTRWRFGRFLHKDFPELGVIDGLEVTHATGGNGIVGASFGYLPEPTPERRTGDDLAISAFYRRWFGDDQDLSLGAALQKTWHEGDADRDLLVLSGDWTPTARVNVRAGASVDLYGSEDVVKPSGLELTELFVHGSWRSEGGDGVAATLSRTRWPELLRDELPTATAELLANREVTNTSFRAWRDLTDEVRLSGRAFFWKDERDDGGGGSVRVTLRDLLPARTRLDLELFTSEGVTTATTGLRASVVKPLERGSLRASWELAQSEFGTLQAGDVDLSRHVLRAGWDTRLGEKWSLSIHGDARLGDEDSTGIGFVLQRRF